MKRPKETALTVDARGAAQLVGVSLTTWRRLVASGKAPKGVALSKKLHFWNRDDIVSWIRGNYRFGA